MVSRRWKCRGVVMPVYGSFFQKLKNEQRQNQVYHSIIGANYVSDPGWVIFYMSLAFFGNGLHLSLGFLYRCWQEKDLIGLTGGTFNFIGGLAAIVVPVAIGYLVNGRDFVPALVFIRCMAFIDAMSYIFLVGKVERIIID